MKKLITISVLSLLVFSCNNNDESYEQNSTELVIKEVTSLRVNDTGPNPDDFTLEKFHYHEDGRPKFYEEYFDNSTTDIWARHFINYTENNLLADLNLAITGEAGVINYEYENNELTFLEWGIPAPNDSYDIVYEGNSIIMTYTPSFASPPTRIETYTFNNEDYDQLVYSETISLPTNGDAFPPRKKYIYDSDSNLTSIINQEYNSDTGEYEDISIDTSITYDDKKNPYKQLNIVSPVISHNLVNLPSSILMDNKISLNNATIVTQNSPTFTIVTQFEFEYNDSGYPMSCIETITKTFNTGQQAIWTYSKTYTYW
ncbi:MAG: hypothetical protein Tsb0033_04440 [Winogradskyella sp.]